MFEILKKPHLIKDILSVRAWSLFNVPMLAYINPSIVALDDKQVIFSVPFAKRNRNHLNSLYFGVLWCGADLASGYLALRKSLATKEKVSFAFKEAKAEFLKRAEAETHFHCQDGLAIGKLLQKSKTTGQRCSQKVTVVATCPSISAEIVAKFSLTLSVRAY